MPSNQVYFSFQDSLGDMWIGTDRGLVKYTGEAIRVFSTRDGLPGEVVLRYYVDSKKRKWFSTHKNGVFYMIGDSVVVPPFHDKLMKYAIYDNYVESLYISGSDKVLMQFSRNSGEIFITGVHEENITIRQIKHEIEENCEPVGMVLSKDGKVVLRSLYNSAQDTLICQRDWKSNILLEIEGEQYEHTYYYEAYRNSKAYKSSFSKGTLNTDMEWVFMRNHLYTVSDGVFEKISDYDTKILFVKEIGSLLMVATYQGGLYVYENNQKGYVLRGHYLENFSIDHISVDRDGVIWLSTLNNGLLQVASINLKLFELPSALFYNNLKQPLYLKNDTVNVAFGNGVASLWADGKTGHLQSIGQYNFLNFHEEAYDAQKVEWHKNLLYFRGYSVDYKAQKPVIKEPFWLNDGADLVRHIEYNPAFDVWYYTTGFLDFQVVRKNEVLLDSKTINFNKAATCFSQNQENIYWVGTYTGLYKLSDTAYEDIGSRYADLAVRIMDVKTDDSGRVFAATQGKGLFIISETDTIQVNISSGLNSNVCTALEVDGDHLYVGTNKGLNRLILKGDGEYDLQHFHFNLTPGIAYINHIYNLGDTLVFQSGRNLIYTSKKGHFTNYIPNIRVDRLIVDGQLRKINKDNSYAMEDGDNNLQIALRMNTLENADMTFYKYRIVDLNDQWSHSDDGLINYLNLATGNYTIEVKGRNSAGNWSETLNLKIRIIPPFYERWWFYVIWLSFILLLIIAYGRWRYMRLETNRKLLTYNIKALSLQINPHFVFNALNSVQYFIATNQKREANLFLSKISTLIRGVLGNAEHSTISLELELKRLEEYIELEKMRLVGQFDYYLEIDESIDLSKTHIMPLLIQPSVENAIWHGLSDIDYPGILLVKIYRNKKKLVIEICDNGPGIPQKIIDAIYEGNIQSSIGLQNTMARMQAMSKIEDQEYKMVLENVKDSEDPFSIRTIIRLIFPFRNS